jgi:hypothetical protein
MASAEFYVIYGNHGAVLSEIGFRASLQVWTFRGHIPMYHGRHVFLFPILKGDSTVGTLDPIFDSSVEESFSGQFFG